MGFFARNGNFDERPATTANPFMQVILGNDDSLD